MSDDRDSRGPWQARPRARLAPGLAAVALFVVLAAAFLGGPAFADVSEPQGFGDAGGAGDGIVHNIGYALFDIDLGSIESEGFLAAFFIIAVGLDVAIDAAIYLAKREDQGSIVTAIADGGRDLGESLRGGGD